MALNGDSMSPIARQRIVKMVQNHQHIKEFQRRAEKKNEENLQLKEEICQLLRQLRQQEEKLEAYRQKYTLNA